MDATGAPLTTRRQWKVNMKALNQFVRNSGFLAAALAASVPAFAGANPSISWNYGTITATPQYPIVGEPAHIAVIVNNTGDTPATNVRVKISFNDWGVTFQGWQEITTITVASIPAGGNATVETDYAFQNRTHTCLEALIVGADEDTDPNDDRGQINLEIINAGETFSYNVPVVNNGDHPLNLLVVGACKGRQPGTDGALPPGPCKEDAKQVNLAPGEELLVPIEIDLHDFAVGQPLDFQLDAYDMGAGGDAFLPKNHNHVLIHIIRQTARNLEMDARNQAAAIAAAQSNKQLQKKIADVVKDIEKALSGDWLDDNHVKRGGGASVFAHTMDAVQRIMAALDAGISREDKIALDALARNLTDAARILAKANNGNPIDIAAGDDNRAAGEYKGAVNTYKHAWQNP